MRYQSGMKKIVLFAAMSIFVAVPGVVRAAGPADCTDIATDKGKVTGKMDRKAGLCVYRGIPFAAPPVGELRFAAPVEPEAWTETRKAYEFGKECLQFPLGFVPTKDPTGSEDCLYLNVWQPVSAAKGPKPVMVFVHGGGFVMGSGSQPWYEGTKLAAAGDLIVVTINYRLGPFGFLVHPALKDAGGHMGNYGMLDQVLALKWVKKNIGAFGGDPENITIFGESAGGMSVGIHLLSPLSKGLFRNAIVQSGPMVLLRGTLEEKVKQGLESGERLGCPGEDAAECLRALDARVYMDVLKPVMGFLTDADASAGMSFFPVEDDFVLPTNPLRHFSEGKYRKDVRVMLGSNLTEAALFTFQKKVTTPEEYRENVLKDAKMMHDVFHVDASPDKLMSYYPLNDYETPKKCYNTILTDVMFTCSTRTLARALAKNGTETWLYLFERPLSDKGFIGDWGAFHAAELFFLFGNMSFMGINAGTPDNLKVSKTMMDLWTSFARTGVPASATAPAWPKYDEKTATLLRIDLKSSLGRNLKQAPCEYIDALLNGAAGK